MVLLWFNYCFQKFPSFLPFVMIFIKFTMILLNCITTHCTSGNGLVTVLLITTNLASLWSLWMWHFFKKIFNPWAMDTLPKLQVHLSPSPKVLPCYTHPTSPSELEKGYIKWSSGEKGGKRREQAWHLCHLYASVGSPGGNHHWQRFYIKIY